MRILDTREQKTPKYLEEPTKLYDMIHKLEIGDFLDTEKKILIEFKIGTDVHNYKQVCDELTRMNAEVRKHGALS